MISTKIELPIDHTPQQLTDAAYSKFRRYAGEYAVGRERGLTVIKRHLDTADKSDLRFIYTVGLDLSEETERRLGRFEKHFFVEPDVSLVIKRVSPKSRPVVIGFGPAGLFAALILAEAGAVPVVLERGKGVDERSKDVSAFFKGRAPDPDSNLQFGEGGAGAFSDGKLKYGKKDRYVTKVLSELIAAGAPEEISYSDSAHIGTDRLPGVVKKIREKIISLGGTVIFGARVTAIETDGGGKIRGVKYTKDGVELSLACDRAILASGHSAHDIFGMLRNLGASMSAKGIGIGMRIEHPQSLINRLVYGREIPPSPLGAASYRLVTHLENGRSVYTFCMCPGGQVVTASTDRDGIVTNGMSMYARDGANANAAYLVSVFPSDYGSSDPLAGLRFQRDIEMSAYSLLGSGEAPCSLLGDFLNRKKSDCFGGVKPTFPVVLSFARPEDFLPGYIVSSLRGAFDDFERFMPGISLPDAVMTGPETRSTCPVRTARDAFREALGIPGLYPCGEGSGEAGGIVSSAVDGIKSALAMIDSLT